MVNGMETTGLWGLWFQGYRAGCREGGDAKEYWSYHIIAGPTKRILPRVLLGCNSAIGDSLGPTSAHPLALQALVSTPQPCNCAGARELR